jgi:hypothetical protein
VLQFTKSLSGISFARMSLIIPPATLNNLSDGTLVGGGARYVLNATSALRCNVETRHVYPANYPAMISGRSRIWPDCEKWPEPELSSGATLG